jgi:hypothetical protein
MGMANKMPVIIQPRDRRIMRHVFAHRVVTYDQVRRKFFPTNFETVSRKRIRKLVKHGYFRSSGAEYHGQLVRVLSLTEKSWPLIAEKWGFEVDKPYFRSESAEHDFRLAEIGLRFEKLTLFARFLPENLLQSSSFLASDPLYRDVVNLQSDGVLVLKGKEGRSILYAVEYEISKKAPERYARKLEGYYRAGGIDGVLYICGDQEIADSVARADRKARTGRDSIVFLALESGVLTSEAKIIFRGVDHGGIGLYLNCFFSGGTNFRFLVRQS